MPIAIVVVLVLVGVVAFVVVSRRRAGRGVPMPGSIAPPAPGRADGLGARVRSIFGGETAQGEDWRRLEELLLRADVGPETARRIVDDVRGRYEAGGDAVALIRDELVSLLELSLIHI